MPRGDADVADLLALSVADAETAVGQLRFGLREQAHDALRPLLGGLRRRFGEAGRERIAEHFTWQRFGDDTLLDSMRTALSCDDTPTSFTGAVAADTIMLPASAIVAAATPAHVPYKSGAEMVTAVLSEQVQMTFPDISILLPLIRDKKLKALQSGVDGIETRRKLETLTWSEPRSCRVCDSAPRR